MKQYEVRMTDPQPAREYQHFVARICDLCGTVTKREDWNAGIYEIDETEIRVEVRQKEGSNYPEGGMGTEYDIDLCPNCFKDKLVPWLISQGANIEKKEWDW